jgi:hypothetical protein
MKADQVRIIGCPGYGGSHIAQKDDLDDMNERELAVEYVRVAQLLLASYEDEETENNDGE